MKHNIVFVACLLSLFSYGQRRAGHLRDSDEICTATLDSITQRNVFIIVDQMPEYKGGLEALRKDIKDHLESPGPMCDYEGTVIVEFLIEVDGKISSKRIVQGYEDDNGCKPNSRALELIEHLDHWSPGKCKGKAVPIKYVLPIRFRI
jgi:periplasmic protein TonB